MGMPIPGDFNPISKSLVNFDADGKPILEFSLPRILSHNVLLPQDKIFNTKTVGTFAL